MSIPSSVIKPIRATLRGLIIATVILYVCLIGAGAYVFVTADTNQQALCALQTDLQVRVDSSREFLKEHPEGIANIDPGTIREGIQNQQRTINVLSRSGLDC